MDLEIKIPLGIGDIIYYKAMLDEIYKTNKYDKIKVCLANGLVVWRGDNKDNIKFAENLLKFLYKEHYYKLSFNEKHKFISLTDMINNFNIIKPKNIPSLCVGKPITQKPYITINSRIRYYHIERYNRMKKQLLAALKMISKDYAIIIIGEKSMEKNRSNTTHSASIHPIYKHLIDLPNVIDATVPKLGVTAPKMEDLKQSCFLMSNAAASVVIGAGGSLAMSLVSSKNTICLLEAGHPFQDAMHKSGQYNKTNVTMHVETFLKNLKQI